MRNRQFRILNNWQNYSIMASNKTPKYQLNVIPGDYGLVSLDPECVQCILYARIAKVPCDIKLYSSYMVCIFYSTPSFVNGKKVFNGCADIMKEFRSLHYNLEFGMNAKQCSQSLALTSMVFHKLRPLLEFVMWVDKRNNEDVINPWFMKFLRLPFNHNYIKKRKQMATDLIEALFSFEDSPEIIKDYLTKGATECLTSLSNKLGKDDFFFQKEPTALDILVYSYLAPFIKLPFISVEIVNMINSLWPNLEAFVKRIDAKYLGDLIEKSMFSKRDVVNQQNDDEVSYSAIVILTLSAMSLIVTFVMNKKFLKM